jgi:hypothetical protein
MRRLVEIQAVDASMQKQRALCFRVLVVPGGCVGLELLPVTLRFCQTRRAVGRELEVVTRRITALSAEMGTQVQVCGRQLWIKCVPRR